MDSTVVRLNAAVRGNAIVWVDVAFREHAGVRVDAAVLLEDVVVEPVHAAVLVVAVVAQRVDAAISEHDVAQHMAATICGHAVVRVNTAYSLRVAVSKHSAVLREQAIWREQALD